MLTETFSGSVDYPYLKVRHHWGDLSASRSWRKRFSKVCMVM